MNNELDNLSGFEEIDESILSNPLPGGANLNDPLNDYLLESDELVSEINDDIDFVDVEDNYLVNYVANKLGLENNTFLTGSVDNPIEKNLNELTDEQLISLLEYNSQETYKDALNNFGLDESELAIVEAIREGRIEELARSLNEELGWSGKSGIPNVSDEELLAWSIKNMYPDITDEDLEIEVDLAKQSPSYETKLKSARNSFENILNQRRVEEENEQRRIFEESLNRERDNLIYVARNTDDIYGFQIDNEIKEEALKDLFEFNEGSQVNKFLENYIDDPEQIVKTAITMKALPRIQEYVNNLHEEIDRLKSQTKRVNSIPNKIINRNINDDSFVDLNNIGLKI